MSAVLVASRSGVNVVNVSSRVRTMPQMVEFGGEKLFISQENSDGTLLRIDGAGFAVAVSASGIGTPQRLFLFDGQVYCGVDFGSAHLVRWAGAGSAWTTAVPQVSEFHSFQFAVVVGSLIYLGLDNSDTGVCEVYTWNGTTLTLFCSYARAPGYNEITQHRTVFTLGGLLYTMTYLGEVFEITASGLVSRVAAFLSSGNTNPRNQGAVYGGQFYAVSPVRLTDDNALPRLLRWDGVAGAWTGFVAPLVVNADRFMSEIVSDGSGTFYAFDNSTTRLLKWESGSAFEVLDEISGGFTSNAFVDSEGNIFFWRRVSTLEHELYQFLPNVVIPEVSALHPGATAKISHARIIRGYRTEYKAHSFHEILRGAT